MLTADPRFDLLNSVIAFVCSDRLPACDNGRHENNPLHVFARSHATQLLSRATNRRSRFKPRRAEGEDTLFSLTTGADNRPMRFGALESEHNRV